MMKNYFFNFFKQFCKSGVNENFKFHELIFYFEFLSIKAFKLPYSLSKYYFHSTQCQINQLTQNRTQQALKYIEKHSQSGHSNVR